MAESRVAERARIEFLEREEGRGEREPGFGWWSIGSEGGRMCWGFLTSFADWTEFSNDEDEDEEEEKARRREKRRQRRFL